MNQWYNSIIEMTYAIIATFRIQYMEKYKNVDKDLQNLAIQSIKVESKYFRANIKVALQLKNRL